MLDHMVVDPIVSVLSKLALSRLNEMRLEASEQITDLQQQLTWIERAVKEKGGSSREPATPPVPQPRIGRRRSSKREAILNVLASRQPGRAWAPSEIRVALDERGIGSSTESVRVALRRMLDAGEVERGGPDGLGWKLPFDDTATTEAPSDEPRSANGYAPEGVLALGSG